MKKPKKILYTLHDLRVGSVVIRSGTVTPEALEIESEELCDGWDRVRNTGAVELDRSVRSAGWHMISVGSSEHAVAVGSLDQETIRTAAERLLRKVRPGMFNCVEVTEISEKHFAGIPYIHLCGQVRHIQPEVNTRTFSTRRTEIRRASQEHREVVHV